MALSDDTLLDRVSVFTRTGNTAEAASEIGISPRSMRRILQYARCRFPETDIPRGPMPKSAEYNLKRRSPVDFLEPEYTPPILPSDDIPLDELIYQMRDNHARIRTARTAAEWMPFDVNDNKPFALAFVGDPHMDARECDIAKLIEHVELIERTPRMWAVGLGDWLNSWAPKMRGQYAFQSVTERDGIRLARWMLQKPIWWLILLGNHDGERWHGQGNALRWFEGASPLPVQEWQAKFSVVCGASSWRVWAAHNFPGHSGFNANHGPGKRALQTGAIADLFVAGDQHTFKLDHAQHEHTGKEYWLARARGYKNLDTYALEKGHGEQGGAKGTGHSIGAVFDPRDGSLQCFSDLHKSAVYLKAIS